MPSKWRPLLCSSLSLTLELALTRLCVKMADDNPIIEHLVRNQYAEFFSGSASTDVLLMLHACARRHFAQPADALCRSPLQVGNPSPIPLCKLCHSLHHHVLLPTACGCPSQQACKPTTSRQEPGRISARILWTAAARLIPAVCCQTQMPATRWSCTCAIRGGRCLPAWSPKHRSSPRP